MPSLAKMFCSEIFECALLSRWVDAARGALRGHRYAEVAKTAEAGVVLFFSPVVRSRARRFRAAQVRLGACSSERHGGFCGGEAAAEGAVVVASIYQAGVCRGLCNFLVVTRLRDDCLLVSYTANNCHGTGAQIAHWRL